MNRCSGIHDPINGSGWQASFIKPRDLGKNNMDDDPRIVFLKKLRRDRYIFFDIVVLKFFVSGIHI